MTIEVGDILTMAAKYTSSFEGCYVKRRIGVEIIYDEHGVEAYMQFKRGMCRHARVHSHFFMLVPVGTTKVL